ncbi:MAG: SurA N-terminal domain-containing protein [Desulfobacterales bacterium]
MSVVSRIRRYPKTVIGVLGAVLLVNISLGAGCRDETVRRQDPVLIRVDERSVTMSDFKAALEIAKAAYSISALKNREFQKSIVGDVLGQLVDELVLMNRAQELGLTVSEKELDDAVREIQADYPGDTFSRTLIEESIPFHLWREGLKKRLLLEKVIKVDLEEHITVTPEDIEDFFIQKKEGREGLHESSKAVLHRLKREKAQVAYTAWIEDLRNRYTIVIDESLLENVNGPDDKPKEPNG